MTDQAFIYVLRREAFAVVVIPQCAQCFIDVAVRRYVIREESGQAGWDSTGRNTGRRQNSRKGNRRFRKVSGRYAGAWRLS